MAPKKYYNHEGYLILDQKPFLPIRKPRYGLPKLPSKGATNQLLKDLKKLDFYRLVPDEVIASVEEIQKGHLIPLGSYGLIDY